MKKVNELEQFISRIGGKLSPIQNIFIALTKLNKCLYCSKKITLLNKKPNELRVISAFDWFTTEALVHFQTTHGFEPDDIDFFLSKYYNLN